MILVRRLVLILLTCALPGGARAEPEVDRPAPPVVLRQWPILGAWRVALLRLDNGALSCALSSLPEFGDHLLFSLAFRQVGPNFAASIIVGDPDAYHAFGNRIGVTVGGTEVIDAALTQRWIGPGLVSGALAELSDEAAAGMLRLLANAESVAFSLDLGTFGASVRGLPGAIEQFDACRARASFS